MKSGVEEKEPSILPVEEPALTQAGLGEERGGSQGVPRPEHSRARIRPGLGAVVGFYGVIKEP